MIEGDVRVLELTLPNDMERVEIKLWDFDTTNEITYQLTCNVSLSRQRGSSERALEMKAIAGFRLFLIECEQAIESGAIHLDDG